MTEKRSLSDLMKELIAIGEEQGVEEWQDFSHKGVFLKRTCFACPEQYDAFIGDKEVGYVRLRHGHLRVDMPFGGKLVYSAEPQGDGIFDNDEREFYLKEVCEAIKAEHETQKDDSKD